MIRKIVTLIFAILVVTNAVTYEPTWESIDSRPLPDWYDDAKFGIFIHWGVYAVPGYISEWFWYHWNDNNPVYLWYMEKNHEPGFTYQEFAKNFKAEFYNPMDWANLFKRSGAKYVVLTSKHHEGYTLWPASRSFSWNSVDVGPHRDLVGELANAIRSSTDLKFGLYHSLLEWLNPVYMSDKASNFTTDKFPQQKVIPELKELVNKYQPEIVWSDGEWEAPDTYWKSREFLAWLYNDSPVKETVVTNDRWGLGISCNHGGFHTCGDRFNPGVLQPHKWENAMTMDIISWGYRRDAHSTHCLKTQRLIDTLVKTVSCGGNILMNVGSTSDGMIAPIYQQRLLDMGDWLSINGEAIYSSKPWTYQNDTGNTWYTSKESIVYAIVLKWPANNKLTLEKVTDLFKNNDVSVAMLGNSGEVQWDIVNDTVDFTFPNKAKGKSKWAWILKIEYVAL